MSQNIFQRIIWWSSSESLKSQPCPNPTVNLFCHCKYKEAFQMKAHVACESFRCFYKSPDVWCFSDGPSCASRGMFVLSTAINFWQCLTSSPYDGPLRILSLWNLPGEVGTQHRVATENEKDVPKLFVTLQDKQATQGPPVCNSTENFL